MGILLKLHSPFNRYFHDRNIMQIPLTFRQVYLKETVKVSERNEFNSISVLKFFTKLNLKRKLQN